MIDKNRHTPATEEFQPDPELRLSSGRANWLQMTLVAAACAFILGIMIYGLNQPVRDGGIVASSPGGQETTGSAPQQEQPQPNEPSQQPTPEKAKPAMPGDSSR